jgi:hypothetical protein
LQELPTKGEVWKLRYKGAGRGGGDIHDEIYENGEFERRMGCAPDGRFGLFSFAAM